MAGLGRSDICLCSCARMAVTAAGGRPGQAAGVVAVAAFWRRGFSGGGVALWCGASVAGNV